MIKKTTWLIAAVLLVLTYALLLYFIAQQQLNTDFSSFYGAALAYLGHTNPYQTILPSFLTTPKDLATNLNPPFFLLLISPLTLLSYTKASLIWAFSSLVLGSLGALICFFLITNPPHFKKNYLVFIMLYLALYGTLMNTSYNQIGGFLFFFITTGFYCFMRRKEYWAGLFWGLAIAVKLFPALLFIFILGEKRYKLFWITSGFFVMFCSVPLLFHGTAAYVQMFKTLNSLIWYGNSWNASIYGYLFRLIINLHIQQNTMPVKLVYSILFIGLFLWYAKKSKDLSRASQPYHAYCLSLLMMLLLSPFGWIYYFSLLLMPLCIIHQKLCNSNKLHLTLLWPLCLLFLNTPSENMQTRYIDSFTAKITMYSVYFYGLVLLIYLFIKTIDSSPEFTPITTSGNRQVNSIIKLILGLGLLGTVQPLLVHYFAL
jgi:hypothetical protein